MTTLIHFLSELARNPAMPLSSLDECARGAGICLTASEMDALRRQDAAGLGELIHPGPKLWCILVETEDQPTPEQSPEQPGEDAPPAEPLPSKDLN